MNNRKSINLVDTIIDEIALEGLDGITLEALWQRIAIRLGDTQPLKEAFMEQIWNICLEIENFAFYELEIPREKLVIFDRYELEYLNIDSDKEYDHKEIYLHAPVEDVKLGIRGSCSTYHTRKNISNEIKTCTLNEAITKYGQKLVIVASQSLREYALMGDNISSTIQIPLTHYCFLERIGRARTIGEITLKKPSNIKEDAKALFYIRKVLQDLGLIRKQVYYQASCGANYNGQNTGTLVHLTRFFNTRKPKVIMWAEHLINYLKSKENYAAEYNEVKTELNLDYTIKKFFKINILQKVFRTDVKVPYRSYYPNSAAKEWATKSNASRERIIKLVTLNDPNIEITDLWRTEEVKDDSDDFQLDIRTQQLNVPFLKQIYNTVESKEFKGASQTELGAELGYTKLISRTLVRNLVKSKIVSTYLDDVGRQRTTKFVSRKFDGKSSVKQQLEDEISKMKEYSRAMQNENAKTVSNNTHITKVIERNDTNTKQVDEPAENKEAVAVTVENTNDKEINSNLKEQTFEKANNIIRKYKLFTNQKRYRYTSSEKNTITSKKEEIKNDSSNNLVNITNEPSNHSSEKENSGNNEENIVDSDFYKTIETKLIVEKPECKKKSLKLPIVGFMANVQNSDNEKQSNLSYRLLRRANLVIESVKQNKIIEDSQKLMKFINKEEDKEGIDTKIDKNSLMRLLQKLAEDNFIKCIKLILKSKDSSKQKIINFICDPSVDINDSVILSAVEKAKLRFCMLETQSQVPNENNESLFTISSIAKDSSMKFPSGEEKPPIIRNNELGRRHGYSPKFVRMKWMHIFLYHLIYDHPGRRVSKNEFLENMRKEDYLLDTVDFNIGNVYTSDISWKMFIPTLPKHTGYPEGWALMSDVLLRMPLSIFVKVYNVNYEVPGLQEILNHPIKQHTLLKDVPGAILNLLFIRRKYMFSIHEIVTRLCYLGLVQFGAQVLKEKDQIFVYLNRRSELLDTTSSAAGYHRVEDKPYPMTKFHFTSMAVVENYWYEMWNTCINTCLGGRSVVEGKDILLEDLSRKIEMIQALKVRAPEEAAKFDTGFVPGDRKGAAGIDSAFFAHLKRNWNWVSTNHLKTTEKKENRPIVKSKATSKISTKPISKLMAARRSFPPKKRSSPSKQNQPKTTSSKPSDTKPPPKLKREKGQLFPVVSCSKPPKIIRKVLPRKPMRKRVKYDEIDFSALQRMDKLRVDWEQHEDNILLVCKVAMVYLCPNPRRNIVSFTAIRDILRSYSFSSHNKTSRACQRRLLYMLKQPKTVKSVLLGVEEVKQDYFVNKRFGRYVDSPRGESEDAAEYEQRIEKIFKELVTYIAKKYYNISDMERREPVPLPKTIQEFNLFHKLKLPTKIVTSPGVSTEVREVNDIHTSTINSVIHSSMCCGKERRSWAYQLFKVYQQYPEYLLRSAMLKIRADQMVTMKKNYMCAHKKFGNCMPMSSSQYQLSSSYYYKFQTKWPYEVFSESYNVILSLMKNYTARLEDESIDALEIRPGLGGVVAVMHDFVGTNFLDVDIEIPDQIIMLDPGLPEKDEVYQRIALRYQTILEGLNSDYPDSKEAQATNLDTNVLAIPANLDNVEPVHIINEQQSFVQIRSAKRTLEEDLCFPEDAKKQKLDSEEKESVMKNDESYKSDKEKNQSNVDVISNNVQFDTKSDNDKSMNTNMLSVIETDNSIIEPVRTSLQVNVKTESLAENISSESMLLESDNDENMEDIEPEIIDISTQCLEQTEDPISMSVFKEPTPHCKNRVGNRVSNLVKQAGNKEIIEDITTRTEIHDVRTRQTRIAMLKMREELHDLTFHDSHHAHEYFVVNSFKLLFTLMASEEDKQDITVYQGMNIPKKLLPLNVEVANKVLEDVKKFAIFPKNPILYDDFKNEILQTNVFEWEDVNEICKYIRTKAEFGATLHELVTEFKYLDNKLADVLSLLAEKRIVLRAGIVTVRYIHYRYINPWIIHSYKILRLEKESHQTVPEGSVYVLDNEDGADDKDKDGKRVTTAANLFYSSSNISTTNVDMTNENFENKCTEDTEMNDILTVEENVEQGNVEKVTDHNISHETSNVNNVEVNDSQKQQTEKTDNVDEELTNQKRLRRNRTVLLKQKDIYRAAKLLDFNTAEEIKVVVKPWIRIDGVVNRRVLDRMLGAVLCYCIEKPGITLTSVQNRFTPAIQPYHTRELIEILVKLGCVKTTVQKMPKVTLFSKPAKLDFSGNPDLVADSDTIIIEATVQATLRFGMFLSNRSYNLDFLSSL